MNDSGSARSFDSAGHPQLGVRWRRFQQRALDDLCDAMQAGDLRLQLVAPPGCGKTLMGLQTALQIPRPIVCLSNTQAIAAQWQERLVEFGSFPAGGPPVTSIISRKLPVVNATQSQRPGAVHATLHPVTSVTYQAFCRQRPAGERKGAETILERLAPEVCAAQAVFGGARVTLVLDECHHLRRWWAEVLADYLQRYPLTQVIGLTATPPSDATGEERRRFAAVVTGVTHEIPLVAAIREGLLAPFADLVRFVRLTAAEERYVAGMQAAVSDFIAQARDGRGEGEDWLCGLDHHVRSRCHAPGRRERTYESFVALLDDDADFAIALARWLHAAGEDLPADVFPVAEMWFAPTRADILAILEDYAIAVLRDDERPAAKKRYKALGAVVSGVGLRLQRNGLREVGGVWDEAVGRSRAKVGAALQVLQREWAELGDDMCAAVITDFERTAVGGRRALSLEHGDVAGAIGAFRAIASAESLRDLKPILATGSMRWISPELLEPLRQKLGENAEKLTVQPVSRELSGGAGSWISVGLSGGSGGLLLRAMTRLLERDHSHCIVGTRGLLGEGWDCRTLNTLVDLTATRAHVAVNQLRGRALRLDPDRPEKVAHIWDIVALSNTVSGQSFAQNAAAVARGSAPIQADGARFVAKHERFHAPAPDGKLERGAGHVHPRLRPPNPQWDDAEQIGWELWESVADREAVRERWKIGEAVQANEVDLLMVPMPAPGDVTHHRAHKVVRRLTSVQLTADRPEAFQLSLRRLGKTSRGLVWTALMAAVGGGMLFAPLSGATSLAAGLFVASAARGGYYAWSRRRFKRASRPAIAPQKAERLLSVVADVLPHAAKRLRGVSVDFDVDSTAARVRLEGGTPVARRRVRDAVSQLLSGCPAPYYALEVLGVADTDDTMTGLLTRRGNPEDLQVLGHVPVPTALGTSRKLALKWAAAFGEHVAPARLVAIRRDASTGEVPWRPPTDLKWAALHEAQVTSRSVLE